MGPHEVVNGANGSVTWCSGPPWCPMCASANPMPQGVHILPMASGHCPGCRCSEQAGEGGTVVGWRCEHQTMTAGGAFPTRPTAWCGCTMQPVHAGGSADDGP